MAAQNVRLSFIAFKRMSNVIAFAMFAMFGWLYLPFWLFMLFIVGIVVFFVVAVAPQPKRNRDAWDDMYPRQPNECVQLADAGAHWSDWPTPVLIVVHSEKKFDPHAVLPYFHHEAFDNATICAEFEERKLPLARYVLWKLGGVMPGNRTAIKNLLMRGSGGGTSPELGPSSSQQQGGSSERNSPAKPAAAKGGAGAQSAVVVAFYDGATIKLDEKGGKGFVDVELTTKTAIQVALNTGVSVAAAVQLPGGTIWVSRPQRLLANGHVDGVDAAASAGAGAAAFAPARPAAAAVDRDTPTEAREVINEEHRTATDMTTDAVDGAIPEPTARQTIVAAQEYADMLARVLQKAYPDRDVTARR